MATLTPEGDRLLTLVHISDLHFIAPCASEGGLPPWWWRYSSRFDGMLGHSEDALLHLHEFLRRLKPEKPRVVVTGDLTACGRDLEFERITKFLTNRLTVLGRPAGLGIKGALALSIPGNHDQWPGRQWMFGDPTRGLANTFPPANLPIPPVTIKLSKGRHVTVMGIDSDSDVGAFTDERFWARGRFVDQVTPPRATAKPLKPNEIRVLMVHHSPCHQGYVLGIEDNSRRALRAFIEQRDISVLLTGHVHVPAYAVTSVTHHGRTWDVLEARCGTTSQIDDNPIEWEAHTTIPPDRLNRNSLLVHRLYDTGTEIKWWTQRITRSDYGFLSPKPEYLGEPIKVWPR